MSAYVVGPAGRWLPARLYDRVMAASMLESLWRPHLVEHVASGIPSGGSVVDVGAGTGALAVELVAALSGAQVIAVEPHPEALAIGVRRTTAPNLSWTSATAQTLELPSRSADAVVLSLVLHHLQPHQQAGALREAMRVLVPGGMLHVADFGRPRDPAGALAFFALRLNDGWSATAPHAAGLLPRHIADCGGADVNVWRRLRTGFGSLELISAQAP